MKYHPSVGALRLVTQNNPPPGLCSSAPLALSAKTLTPRFCRVGRERIEEWQKKLDMTTVWRPDPHQVREIILRRTPKKSKNTIKERRPRRPREETKEETEGDRTRDGGDGDDDESEEESSESSESSSESEEKLEEGLAQAAALAAAPPASSSPLEQDKDDEVTLRSDWSSTSESTEPSEEEEPTQEPFESADFGRRSDAALKWCDVAV
jgi:hypothetical protein